MRILNASVWLLSAACAALLLAACSPRETPAEKAARNGILLAGNGADPSSLDPSLATGLGDFKILCALFEGLVRADPETLEPLPAVAKSWEISPDKTIYRFRIDERAKWSDGSPVLASDFVFAWRRAVDPVIGAEYASLLFPIKNAKKINSGLEPDIKSLGVRAPDPLTLEVELESPTPYFLSLLYLSATFPLPEKVLKKFGAERSRDAAWTRPENIVGNGPFALEKWSINDRVSLRRNPHFREKEKILLNGIEFLPISNVNTEDRAFRAGQLHITESVAPQRLDSARKCAPETVSASDWLGVYYYLFNTTVPPLDNPKVRRALAMAIDRRAIIDTFLKGGQKSAFSFVPPNCGSYSYSGEKLAFDPAGARKLLAEAGYPKGKNFPRISISYNTSEQHKPIAEAVQNMWKENLGVEADLYNLSWPAYLAARRTGDFQIARSSWIADFAAPESFLKMFESDSGLNHALWKNRAYDQLMREAENAPAEQERNEKLSQAESLLLRECPIIPIYFYSKICLKSPMLRGWKNNPLDLRDYRGVELSTKKEVGK